GTIGHPAAISGQPTAAASVRPTVLAHPPAAGHPQIDRYRHRTTADHPPAHRVIQTEDPIPAPGEIRTEDRIRGRGATPAAKRGERRGAAPRVNTNRPNAVRQATDVICAVPRSPGRVVHPGGPKAIRAAKSAADGPNPISNLSAAGGRRQSREVRNDAGGPKEDCRIRIGAGG